MRKGLFLFVLLFTVTSCKTDDDNGLSNTCSVSNPVEDLSWLKERIDDIKQSSQVDEFYVSQITYKGQTVFIIRDCCAACNSVTTVSYCSGELVFNLNDEDDKEEYTKFIVSNQGDIIWTSQNFTCNI